MVFDQQWRAQFGKETALMAATAPLRSCCLRSDRFSSMILPAGPAVLVGLFLLAVSLGCEDSSVSGAERSRRFRFDYGARLKGLRSGATIRVWMPVPPSHRDQTVRELHRDLPAKGTVAREPKYGNRILSFKTVVPSSGRLAFSVSYQVRRWAIQPGRLKPPRKALTGKERRLYLSANTKVPIEGKPLRLLRGMRLPGVALPGSTLPGSTMKLARILYDRVDASMRYDKSQPGYGRGDVLWACDSHFGNCTDFHSLFISLARSQKLPARFEIGFPLPNRPGRGVLSGYHCWAYFYEKTHGWVPVDISEADKHPDHRDAYFGQLNENRISLSIGRDLKLVPPQTGRPLNFFVYPYAEVDGKPLSPSRMESRFSYADSGDEPSAP